MVGCKRLDCPCAAEAPDPGVLFAAERVVGGPVGVDVENDRNLVCLRPASRLLPVDIDVPADPSSAAFFVALTGYKLLLDGWRGYLLAWFALVWVANMYMSAFGRLRLDIKRERVEIEGAQAEVEQKTTSKPDKKAA